MKTAAALLAAFTLVATAAQGAEPATNPAANDYPTATRVDYVIGCMATNGQTQEVMARCSCSIDHIAASIPYQDFVQVETVRRLQETPGERAGLFRSVGWIKDLQERFRLAQVEADLECFPN